MDKVSHDADDFDRCWASAKYNDYVVATARALARCVLRLRVQDLDLGERAGARLAPSRFRTRCRKKIHPASYTCEIPARTASTLR